MQGITSVSAYYNKLRNLWDEVEALMPPSTCDCEKSKGFVAHIDRQKLYQFLMDLNEMYHQAKSQILLMNLLPNINQAYAMLVGNKAQKFVVSTTGDLGMNIMTSNNLDAIILNSRAGNHFNEVGGGCTAN